MNNPTLTRLRSTIATAKLRAPTGPRGESLCRVLDDLIIIAVGFEDAGTLDAQAAGLAKLVAVYSHNAQQLAAGD